MRIPTTEIGLGMLAAAGLLALAQAPAMDLFPVDAVDHEGRRATVHGFAQDVRTDGDGCRFVLVTDGHALPVQAEGDPPPAGAWTEATGRIVRVHGRLTLLADRVAWTS